MILFKYVKMQDWHIERRLFMANRKGKPKPAKKVGLRNQKKPKVTRKKLTTNEQEQIKKIRRSLRTEREKRKQLEKERATIVSGLNLILNYKGDLMSTATPAVVDPVGTTTAKPQPANDPLEALAEQVAMILSLLERGQAEDAERLRVLEEEERADDKADVTRDQRLDQLGAAVKLLKEDLDEQRKLSPQEEQRIAGLWTKMQDNARRLKALADAETARP